MDASHLPQSVIMASGDMRWMIGLLSHEFLSFICADLAFTVELAVSKKGERGGGGGPVGNIHCSEGSG